MVVVGLCPDSDVVSISDSARSTTSTISSDCLALSSVVLDEGVCWLADTVLVTLRDSFGFLSRDFLFSALF